LPQQELAENTPLSAAPQLCEFCIPRLLLKRDGVLAEHFCPLEPEPPY
jgi:hypothetical protein